MIAGAAAIRLAAAYHLPSPRYRVRDRDKGQGRDERDYFQAADAREGVRRVLLGHHDPAGVGNREGVGPNRLAAIIDSLQRAVMALNGPYGRPCRGLFAGGHGHAQSFLCLRMAPELVEKQHVVAVLPDQQVFGGAALVRPGLRQRKQAIPVSSQHEHTHGPVPVPAHDGGVRIEHEFSGRARVSAVKIGEHRGRLVQRAQSIELSRVGQACGPAGAESDACLDVKYHGTGVTVSR